MRKLDTPHRKPSSRVAQEETMADSQSQIDAAAIAAKAVLESHLDYPTANVKIHDAIRRQGLIAKLQRSPLGSNARMKTVIKLFDLRAASYIELVRDMKLQNAFVFALKVVIAHTAWIEFTGFSLNELNPSSPEGQRHLQTILDRARHWEVEGLRRLMPNSGKAKAKPKARQGYRAHIRSWMKDNRLRRWP
jgi:hypothetical protein